MIRYDFRPPNLVSETVRSTWEELLANVQRSPGPKIVALWCAIPPGCWNMRDVTIGATFCRIASYNERR